MLLDVVTLNNIDRESKWFQNCIRSCVASFVDLFFNHVLLFDLLLLFTPGHQLLLLLV